MRLRSAIAAASSAAAILALSGCYSMPLAVKQERVGEQEILDKVAVNKSWTQRDPITVLESNVGKLIAQPSEIPDSILEKEISLSIGQETVLRDVLFAISSVLEVPVSVDSKELLGSEIFMPSYSGNLGGFLEGLRRSLNMTFSWEEGTLIAQKTSEYIVTLPQDQELISKVVEELNQWGIETVQGSVSTGMVMYRTTPYKQKEVAKYLDRLVKNSSLITLQVMTININLERERKEGFNWGSLQAKLGDLGMSTSLAESSASEGTSLGSVIGEAMQIGENTASIRIARDSVDIAGMFDLLSTYGNTETTQDIILKTLSGKEVTIESTQQIPYVSDINSTVTESGFSNSGISTSVAKNGITMNFSPYYEAESELVSIDMNISLETLLGFVEMSAGNQLGEITQPRVQVQDFNNTLRVPVGTTTIIGGVTYESLSDNRTSLSYLDQASLANINKDLVSNSLFIVVRPTVTTYEPSE